MKFSRPQKYYNTAWNHNLNCRHSTGLASISNRAKFITKHSEFYCQLSQLFPARIAWFDVWKLIGDFILELPHGQQKFSKQKSERGGAGRRLGLARQQVRLVLMSVRAHPEGDVVHAAGGRTNLGLPGRITWRLEQRWHQQWHLVWHNVWPLVSVCSIYEPGPQYFG